MCKPWAPVLAFGLLLWRLAKYTVPSAPCLYHQAQFERQITLIVRSTTPVFLYELWSSRLGNIVIWYGVTCILVKSAAFIFSVEDLQGMFHTPDCTLPPSTLFRVVNLLSCILQVLGTNSGGTQICRDGFVVFVSRPGRRRCSFLN
jgi:hypothetical protein